MPDQKARIEIYRTRSCPFCMQAAAYLEQLGATFEEIWLDDHPDRREATSAILSGHGTVPLIVIDGEPIGGYQELVALDAAGELCGRIFA